MGKYWFGLKFALFALVVGAVSTSHASEQYQADFGSWLPSTHALNVNAFEPWVKLVEQKSKGRVKITLHHGAVLGSSKTVLNDVKGGVYQIGLIVPGYYYDTPMFTLLIGGLPFAVPGPVSGKRVMNEFLRKYEGDIFQKFNLKNMGVLLTDANLLFSTAPIRRVKDLEGLKMRASKDWVPIVKAWGAVPTPMQPEELYMALERGTMNVVTYSATGSMSWKFFEPAPYVTKLEAPISVIGMVMNRTFYDKLPVDLKKLFDEELNSALIDMMVKTYDKGTEDTLEKIAKIFKTKGKGEIITLSAEEKSKFVKPAAAEWDAWVKEANKRGLPGDVMMTDFKAILRTNGIAIPF